MRISRWTREREDVAKVAFAHTSWASMKAVRIAGRRTAASLVIAFAPRPGLRMVCPIPRLRPHLAKVEVHVLTPSSTAADFKSVVRSLHGKLPRALMRLQPRVFVATPGSARRLQDGSQTHSSELADLVASVPKTVRLAYLRMLLQRQERRAHLTFDAPRELSPIATSRGAQALADEIALLAPHRLLLRRPPFEVYAARAHQVPYVLDEICRQRELSFRMVGEGTGLYEDRDEFDAHYKHLFVWHREMREIVGSYRLACSEEVLPRFGVAGFYSSTLFDLDGQIFARVGPAMELGRSFVAPQWQRSVFALALLWSGIMALVAARPQVRYLFGPVSISDQYCVASRSLMASALMAHFAHPELRTLVRPRNPPSWPSNLECGRKLAGSLDDPKLLSRVIASMEQGPGLPVLVRKYLELHGRFAGFSIDRNFGDSLDGLVFVDAAHIPRSILTRMRSSTQQQELRATRSSSTLPRVGAEAQCA